MDIISLYQQAGAYHEGHFLLASGRHSPKFFQSTTVMQYPKYAELIGSALGQTLADLKPDFVLGPAMGGVVLSYLVAKNIGCRSLFAEKAVDEQGQKTMQIRDAFKIEAGQRFVAVEDVVTTGGSLLKAVRAAQAHGAICVGLGFIIDRRKEHLPLEGIPVRSLEQIYFDTYAPDQIPEWLAEIPLQEI